MVLFLSKKFKSFILNEKEKEEKGLAKFIIDEKDIRVEHSHFHIHYRKNIALEVCIGCLGLYKDLLLNYDGCTLRRKEKYLICYFLSKKMIEFALKDCKILYFCLHTFHDFI